MRLIPDILPLIMPPLISLLLCIKEMCGKLGFNFKIELKQEYGILIK